MRTAIAAPPAEPFDDMFQFIDGLTVSQVGLLREAIKAMVPEVHVHEWESGVVIERMMGEQEGHPRVLWCLSCGEVKER